MVVPENDVKVQGLPAMSHCQITVQGDDESVKMFAMTVEMCTEFSSLARQRGWRFVLENTTTTAQTFKAHSLSCQTAFLHSSSRLDHITG